MERKKEISETNLHFSISFYSELDLELQCAYINIGLLLEQTEFMQKKLDAYRIREKFPNGPNSVTRVFSKYLQEKIDQLLAEIIETNYLRNMRVYFNRLVVGSLHDKNLIFPNAHQLDEGDFKPAFNPVGNYVVPWLDLAVFISGLIENRRGHTIG